MHRACEACEQERFASACLQGTCFDTAVAPTKLNNPRRAIAAADNIPGGPDGVAACTLGVGDVVTSPPITSPKTKVSKGFEAVRNTAPTRAAMPQSYLHVWAWPMDGIWAHTCSLAEGGCLDGLVAPPRPYGLPSKEVSRRRWINACCGINGPKVLSGS